MTLGSAIRMSPGLKGFFNNSKKNILLAGTIVICLIFLEMGLRVHYVLTYSESIEEAYKYPQNPKRGSHVMLGAMMRPSPHERIIYELKPNLNVGLLTFKWVKNSVYPTLTAL